MAIYSRFSHEKWWFSIAMLNYQRVNVGNEGMIHWLTINNTPIPIHSLLSTSKKKYHQHLFRNLFDFLGFCEIHHVHDSHVPYQKTSHWCPRTCGRYQTMGWKIRVFKMPYLVMLMVKTTVSSFFFPTGFIRFTMWKRPWLIGDISGYNMELHIIYTWGYSW